MKCFGDKTELKIEYRQRQHVYQMHLLPNVLRNIEIVKLLEIMTSAFSVEKDGLEIVRIIRR